MHIEFIEVSNFRKLKGVRIDMAEDTTLLVGANNSGKTSAMHALRHFLVDDKTADFAKRYLRTTHCDLFFADAAILVEGPAERMLIPHFIRHHFSHLHQCYLTTAAELGASLFESLKTGKKAEFALDVLALQDPAKFIVPNYIDEGLSWLETQLTKRQLEVVEADAKAAEFEA